MHQQACWRIVQECSLRDGSSPLVVYQGIVLQTVKVISNLTRGGQILMDTATTNEIARAREPLLAELSVKARGITAPTASAASEW